MTVAHEHGTGRHIGVLTVLQHGFHHRSDPRANAAQTLRQSDHVAIAHQQGEDPRVHEQRVDIRRWHMEHGAARHEHGLASFHGPQMCLEPAGLHRTKPERECLNRAFPAQRWIRGQGTRQSVRERQRPRIERYQGRCRVQLLRDLFNIYRHHRLAAAVVAITSLHPRNSARGTRPSTTNPLPRRDAPGASSCTITPRSSVRME